MDIDRESDIKMPWRQFMCAKMGGKNTSTKRKKREILEKEINALAIGSLCHFY